MFHRFLILLYLSTLYAMAACQYYPSPILKGNEHGNGGDSISIRFEELRKAAADKIARVEECEFTWNTNDSIKNWILENKSSLQEDILASHHQWVIHDQGSCARTSQRRNSVVTFSYKNCDSKLSDSEIVSILIHESSHHFNQNEQFSNQVANSLNQARRGGRCQPSASEVFWTDIPSIMTWPETSKLEEVLIKANQVCVKHSKATEWLSIQPFLNQNEHWSAQGNIWVIAHFRGQWVGATFEWIRTSGSFCETADIFDIARNAKLYYSDPKTNARVFWTPAPDELIGFMVTTPARHGRANLYPTESQRSDIFWTRWPKPAAP